jgi:membrane-associated protein
VFDAVLNALTASAWTYVIVMAVVAVDAFFPLVPGDGATITAAILAANGDLSIVLVVAAGFLGATAGDNFSYLLGHKLGSRAAQRLFRSEKSRTRLEWARNQLRQRGVTLIVGARFIPGGRTATSFAAGTLDMRWRRFLTGDLIGTFGWALFTSLLGYLGGQAFHQSLWKPLLLSFGISALIVLSGELWQRRSRRAAGRPVSRRHDGRGSDRRGEELRSADGRGEACRPMSGQVTPSRNPVASRCQRRATASAPAARRWYIAGRMPPSQGSDEATPAGKRPLAEQSAGRQLRRGLHTSVVDNSTAFGFSIMITCSFGVLSNFEGSPSIGAILSFGLAAAATFTLLHALASDLFRHRPQTAPRQVVMLGTALNFSPWASELAPPRSSVSSSHPRRHGRSGPRPPPAHLS